MELIFHKEDQWAFEGLQVLAARSPDGYIKLLSMWKTMGDEGLVLTIKPPMRFKTRSQENYYRKWCGQFAKHCGLTPDEMHEEIFEEAESKVASQMQPIANEITCLTPPSEAVQQALSARIQALQLKAGYDGDFQAWVAKQLPVRLEDMLGGH